MESRCGWEEYSEWTDQMTAGARTDSPAFTCQVSFPGIDKPGFRIRGA